MTLKTPKRRIVYFCFLRKNKKIDRCIEICVLVTAESALLKYQLGVPGTTQTAQLSNNASKLHLYQGNFT